MLAFSAQFAVSTAWIESRIQEGFAIDFYRTKVFNITAVAVQPDISA